MGIKSRWKKTGEERPFDHNVVDGKVPWFTNLIRFFKPIPKGVDIAKGVKDEADDED